MTSVLTEKEREMLGDPLFVVALQAINRIRPEWRHVDMLYCHNNELKDTDYVKETWTTLDANRIR